MKRKKKLYIGSKGKRVIDLSCHTGIQIPAFKEFHWDKKRISIRVSIRMVSLSLPTFEITYSDISLEKFIYRNILL